MICIAEECEGMMCLVELVIIAGEVELVYSLLFPSPSGTDLCLCIVYRKCSLQFSKCKDCVSGTAVEETLKTLTQAQAIVNMYIFKSLFSLSCILKIYTYLYIDQCQQWDKHENIFPPVSQGYVHMMLFLCFNTKCCAVIEITGSRSSCNECLVTQRQTQSNVGTFVSSSL